MTNEEAKKLLQNNLDFENGKKGIYPCPIEQYKLALEVAIEALNTQDDLCANLAWYINERVRLLKVIEYSKPHDGLQRTIQKALERSHGEWIPCSERLPEESGWYIGSKVTPKGNHMTNAFWYEDGNFFTLGKIVAWMPLPEPYNGGEAEWLN